jgi:hypothetical protein
MVPDYPDLVYLAIREILRRLFEFEIQSVLQKTALPIYSLAPYTS